MIKKLLVIMLMISSITMLSGCLSYSSDIQTGENRYNILDIKEYHTKGSFGCSSFDGYIVTYITNENMIKTIKLSSRDDTHCVSIFHTDNEPHLIIRSYKYNTDKWELYMNATDKYAIKNE